MSRGKPFVKGEDPRRQHGSKPGHGQGFTREMRECLLSAAENVGNRLAAISNEKLPKRPTKKITRALIDLLRLDPKGMTSYFEWLAEYHPAIFASLLGRAMPQIMQQEGEDIFDATYATAEEIAAELKKRGLPPLQDVFKLPKRIDLCNPPTIEATPENEC